eukprot:2607065-Pyramimonas_sp.AAC.1
MPNSIVGPWRLALYIDDVVPGDILRVNQKRRTTCWSVGKWDTGHYRRCEEAWLLVGVVRATVAKGLRGCGPGAARAHLRSLLLGTGSVFTAGASVSCGSQSRIVNFKYPWLISDKVASQVFSHRNGFGIVQESRDAAQRSRG